MIREEMLAKIRARAATREPWDIAIVGGGATGMGVAVDAASRGLSAVLVEAHDFGKGTSSRSTKLVHGGVRYLEQGNIPLVMSALKERGLMRQNAPHIVHDLAFIVPNYSWWEAPFYGIGLKLYDMLAGKYGFGRSQLLSRDEALTRLPALEPQGLLGGVVYYDGQFDDARLLIHLAMTAADHGATLLNYCPATSLTRDAEGYVDGLSARDAFTGEEFMLQARIVINATGVFTDEIRRMGDPAADPLMVTSQGIHLVFDRSFLRGDTALMVPKTSDGRVLFVIPWHGHAVAGTTDTPVDAPSLEPRPLEEEIDFVLETAGRFFVRPPSRADILAVFVGLRPLVKGDGKTSALSRDHVIHVDTNGLLTITGGKWTTYRHMAEDTVDHAITLGKLPDLACPTRNLRIHGYLEAASLPTGAEEHLAVYGTDADVIRELAINSTLDPASNAAAGIDLAAPLHPALPYTGAEVLWAARAEMAATVEDVLARRTRALFLNARAAIAMAEPVAKILAAHFGYDEAWIAAQVSDFRALGEQYRVV
jgi:glycerol-3-phosphate dehydrogenase